MEGLQGRALSRVSALFSRLLAFPFSWNLRQKRVPSRTICLGGVETSRLLAPPKTLESRPYF